MICSRCQKNSAVVYYYEKVNGVEKRYALCKACADAEREKQIYHNSFGVLPFWGADKEGESLFSTLFGVNQPETKRKKRCELCGLSFSDIVHSGKVGCPLCYTTFREELTPTVNSIHGAEKHKGRHPHCKAASQPQNGTKAETAQDVTPKKEKSAERKPTKEEKLAKLKESLKKAIAEEAYEEAATLRDKIKKLEGRA